MGKRLIKLKESVHESYIVSVYKDRMIVYFKRYTCPVDGNVREESHRLHFGSLPERVKESFALLSVGLSAVKIGRHGHSDYIEIEGVGMARKGCVEGLPIADYILYFKEFVK